MKIEKSTKRKSRLSGDKSPKIEMSFEFFPPKSEKAEQRFWHSLEKLAPLKPRFVSVTYGAGGSTRERTLQIGRASCRERV